MTVYTPQQVAQFNYNAGFRGLALTQATAVALAESSGNADAKNSIGASGLFQFIPSTWASVAGASANPFDPQANANAAFKLWQENGQTFSGEWQTWDNGQAQAQMGTAAQAASQIKGNAPVPGSVTGSGTISGGINIPGLGNVSIPGLSGGSGGILSSIFSPILAPIFEFALTSAMVTGGAALMLFGAYVVGRKAS